MNKKVEELVEGRAKILAQEDNCIWDDLPEEPTITAIRHCKWRYRRIAKAILSHPDLALEFTREWVDIPTERGEYWISPFIEGKYIAPRILSVIDYERPDRGLEVEYDFPHDTIPVKTFVEEYYPNAKWMLIKVPVIPLSELEEGE